MSTDPPPGRRPRRSHLALAGPGLAALACGGLGWLAYRILQPGPGAGPAAPSALESTPTVSIRRSAAATSTSEPRRPALPARPEWAALAMAPPARAQARCLAGDQAEQMAAADPSNYGERQPRNWKGEAVPHTPSLIVLHETVVDEPTALALFQRHQSDDFQQASYHVLIARDGRRIRLVADERRAFGAGDSDFQGMAVQLRPAIPASVNNIALHVSLVSPADGADGERSAHSGYTRRQYASLARQLALWQSLYAIPASRVVTHQQVDRSGSRRDPRSFRWTLLARDLRQLQRACGALPGGPRVAAHAPAAATPAPIRQAASSGAAPKRRPNQVGATTGNAIPPVAPTR